MYSVDRGLSSACEGELLRQFSRSGSGRAVVHSISSSAKMAGILAQALLRKLRPGGSRTSLCSIQWLARRHRNWFRVDLATLLAMLTANGITPHIAAVRSLDEVPTALMT